jgi:hypothetical protein
MWDLIFSISLIAGTYLGSAVFAIVLFRIFFPLKKKSIESKLTLTYSKHRMSNAPTKHRIEWSAVNRGRDWVKINS